MPPRPLSDVVIDRRDELTTAERKVADALLADPEAVAFGTVAELARRAGSSGATVVRLATRLGFEGFSDLQEAVQAELARRLRPATERIREAEPGDVVGRALAASLESVHDSLTGADPSVFDAIVRALSARAASVWVVCGDEGDGVGRHFASQLQMLGRRVDRVDGNAVRVAMDLAMLGPAAVVVAIDIRRYDQWVVEWVQRSRARGARVIAFTDSHLSPLAEVADDHLVVAAEGAGPFDSYVGVMALLDAVAAGVARRLQRSATKALDAIEDAWRDTGALME